MYHQNQPKATVSPFKKKNTKEYIGYFCKYFQGSSRVANKFQKSCMLLISQGLGNMHFNYTILGDVFIHDDLTDVMRGKCAIS